MTECIWYSDALVKVHVEREDADGDYAVVEVLAPSGHWRPVHLPEDATESYLVLEGEITLHAPAGATTIRPGESGSVRGGGGAHAVCVTSAGPARMVVVSSAADLVDGLRACGRPAEYAALPSPGAQRLPAHLVRST